jgi:VWFA-related protein
MKASRLVLLALCIASAPLPVGAQSGGDESLPKVSFVTPRHFATVLGPTKLEASVENLPAGVEVEQLIFTVDGVAEKALSGPPWVAQWDAGDQGRGYRLEVIARLSNGEELSQVIATSELRINQRESVDLVNIYPVVRDRSGGYISDLTKADFKVLERGRDQRIDRFTTERRPLRIGIVLDTSLSMSDDNKLNAAQQAALSFVESLEQDDQGMVVTFSDRVRVRQDFTSNHQQLRDAIAATEADGGTALYDAVWRTARMLRDFDARRVIVLLSDGRDEATSGFEPGSLHTLDEALDQALRSEVMVFSIGLGAKLERECTRQWERRYDSNREGCPAGESLEDVLSKLSQSTGGRLLVTKSSRKLRSAFENVAEDLRNQYSIAYSSNDPNKDGEWREIEVSVPKRPDLRVVTRDGYFAVKK